MKTPQLLRLRLQNQSIAGTGSENPADALARLGALQAQDYPSVLWAVGLRTRNSTEKDIERAIQERAIVHTWMQRGTLHIVAASDLRWMLGLLGPRLLAGARGRHGQLGLDDTTFKTARDILVLALQGGKTLPRDEIFALLEAAAISTAGQRGIHILWQLAVEGLLCFGARRGKQPTFVLLDEWVPTAKTIERDQALAKLALRYFTSRGPATLPDFVWWSGLTGTQARAGLDMAGANLENEIIDGQTYWFPASQPAGEEPSPALHLLPAFDEYILAYQDRVPVLEASQVKQAISSNGIFYPTLVINGRVRGTWKRTVKKGSLTITPNLFAPLTAAEEQALQLEAGRYAAFLGLSLASDFVLLPHPH